MAFPEPLSVTRTVNTGSGAHVANFPAVVDAGDLLVLAALASANIGTVSGFTRLGDGLLASYGFDILVKEAVGDEDGGSVSTGVAAGNLGIYHMWRIQAGTWSGDILDIDISAIAEGTSTTINPPSVTAGGGSADNLFMTFAGIEEEDGFSAAPANYSGLTSDTDAINTSLGSAWRKLAAASDDPGNWTFLGTSSAWGAWTIVIPPASASPVAIALTPAILASSAISLGPTPAPAVVALTPASLASGAQALTVVPAALSLVLSPAVLASSAQGLTVLAPVSIALVPALLASSAQVLVVNVPQPVVIELGVATIATSAELLEVILTTPELVPALVAVQAQPLAVVAGPVVIALAPASVVVEAIMPGTVQLNDPREARPDMRYKSVRRGNRKGAHIAPPWR